MNEIVPADQVLPMDLMQRAVASGSDIGVLERLMTLQERYEANQARKAFNEMLASAKAEMKPIRKSRTVDYTTNRGRVHYQYEDLNDVTEAVSAALSKYGFSFRWRTDTLAPGQFSVTCILAHRDGHSEENSLPGSADNSGNKNPIQSVGSTTTYLQRYTLKAALGLSAAIDDDAQAEAPPAKPVDYTPYKPDETEASGNAYVLRWQEIMASASTADELKMQWNGERVLRGKITWNDREQPARLKEMITRRIEELELDKPSDAQP